ncbi:UNVERIFIED_CONTAM: hypothetical protein HDU68_010084 [Siphonaria sp. JEL0065]|nr:hypothetical protein HDU68_010084 [Siphonaria sp. JEL0065]
MEKYVKWKDVVTGINPFLPTRGRRDSDSGGNPMVQIADVAKKNVLGPMVSLCKLVVVAVVVAMGVVLFKLSVFLSLVPSLKRAWVNLVSFLFGRLSLALLGFYWINEELLWLKKGIREKRDLKKSTVDRIESGDIIVANHSSYIDILYLFTFHAPVFTKFSPETGLFRVIPFGPAMMRTGEYPSLNDLNAKETLQQICQRAKDMQSGPVIVFPEATTTNGRALLQFAYDGLFDQVNPNQFKIHVMGFRYHFQDYSPSYVICKYSPMNFELGDSHDGPIEGQLSEAYKSLSATILNILIAVTRLKVTGFSVRDKREFFDLFLSKENSETKGVTSKKKMQ